MLLGRVGPRAAAAVHPRRADGRRRRGELSDGVRPRPGAVAAPTAGLHFTKELLQTIAAARRRAFGGHAARRAGNVSADRGRVARRARDAPRVGRAIGETAAAELNATRKAGRRLDRGRHDGQRGCWRRRCARRVRRATTSCPGSGETDLFIRPPFEFQAIDALLTNFHFPRTTLLVLVATFAGRELIERAYHEAIAKSTASTATATRC